MKGKDLYIFCGILLVSLALGIVFSDYISINYSDLITFMSIMIWFKITSLAILFNSPLRKTLWDKKNKDYQTELHRIKDYYKHSIVFEVISILIIFATPNDFNVVFINIHFEKNTLTFPILLGTVFCLYKICKDLFRIFTYPTND